MNLSDTRVGIQGLFELPNGNAVWNFKYYHDDCISNSTKRKLVLDNYFLTPEEQRISESSSPSTKKAKISSTPTKQETATTLTESQRRELREDLRRLRLHYASIVGCEGELYKIFPYKTLEELVYKLPSNKKELVNVWGIKAVRSHAYGDAILEVIEYHVNKKYRKTERRIRRALNMDDGNHVSPRKNCGKRSEQSIAESDDEEEGVEMERLLSVDEILDRKLREAEARGEVVDVDF